MKDIFKLNFILNKRQKIIIASFLITLVLLSTQTSQIFFIRYRFTAILAVLAYLLSLWALWEGITKLKAVLLLILPTMFAVAVATFYFLLPIRWLTRLPVALIFALSFYSLLLSQNVFNVAAIRTIPLYRAASTVSFLFSLITAFFLFNVIFSLNLQFYWNGLITGLISLPLVLQLLWMVEMEQVTIPILIYSFIFSLIVGETAIALSFWPVAPTIWSLSLATVLYVLLGIGTEFLRDRLNNHKLVWEYLAIGSIVLIFSFLITSWSN